MSKRLRTTKRLAAGRQGLSPGSGKPLAVSSCLLLALITLIAYEPLRHNGFVDYDTNDYVTANPQVKSGLTAAAIKWAFELPFDQANADAHAGNYHPLTWLSHMLDCRLFGLNPLGHHLTNLFFHLASTLLLYGVLYKMTGALWCGFLTAVLFAVHPLHVESVAWVAERKDVLSGFFFMLTIASYIFYVRRPTIIRYFPVFFTFALGLLAKPMLVTLPLVLLLLDYWPLNRLFPKPPPPPKTSGKLKVPNAYHTPLKAGMLILEKIPLLALSLVSCIITYKVQQNAGAVKTAGAYPGLVRLDNAYVSYINYIIKMFYPRRLAVLYPHPADNIPPWQPIICVLLLITLTILIIYIARRRRYLTVGWLWYLGTLVPVIGLVQVGIQAMADRYTYIPLIGLFIIIAWGGAELIKAWPKIKMPLAAGACIWLLILMIGTRLQLPHWKNTNTLYDHTLAATKNNYLIHYNLGRVLVNQNMTDQAAFHFSESIRINPDYHKAHNNLGIMLAQTGDLTRAMGHFKEAIRINSKNGNAHYNLGRALYMTGEIGGAMEHFQASLKIDKDSFETLNDLSWIFATSKEAGFRNGAQAVLFAQKACELTNYHNAETLTSLAAAYAEAGRFPEAAATAQKAIDLYRAAGQNKLAESAAGQQRLYQARQPYRDK